MKMYRPYKRIAAACMAALLTLAACDNDFEEMNTNPDAQTKVTPTYMFTKAQLDGAANMMLFLAGTVQYTTAYNEAGGFGSKYTASWTQNSFAFFNNAYPKEINEIEEV